MVDLDGGIYSEGRNIKREGEGERMEEIKRNGER